MPNSGDQSTSSNNTGSNSTLTTPPEITGCEKKLGVSEVSSNAGNVSTIGGVINSKEEPAAVEKTSAISNQSTSIISEEEQAPVQPAGYVPEKSTDNIQTDIKSPINGNSDDEQPGVPEILAPEQKSDTKTNGKLPNNPGNGSITATQNTQKTTVAIWTFAVAGILAGAAASAAYFAFSISLLTTGIIAGVGVCCLVAALIIYCCNRPSNSLEGSNVEPVANGELTVS